MIINDQNSNKGKDIYIGESNGLKKQLNDTLDKFRDIKTSLIAETDNSIFGEQKVTDKK